MNNSSKQVLLVEDSKEIYRMINQSLAGPLLSLTWAETMAKAKEVISKQKFDLILLDIELPDGSGLELCTELQANSPSTSIFFLTGHDDLSEKVLGFSAGADDYITKPFNTLELKARVEAKLKKQEIFKVSSDILNWKEVKINKSTQEVNILEETGEYESVELTSLELKILLYFAERVGHVVDRDSMLNDIWGQDVHVYSRSVDTHVSKLRKKLGPASHIIQSVHGTGYKFVPTE